MVTENPDWGDFDHFDDSSIVQPSPCNDQDASQKPNVDHPRNSQNFLLGVPTSDDITTFGGVECLSRVECLLDEGFLEECFSVDGKSGCSEHVRISLVDNDRIWQRVLDNFGCLLPVEWNKSCFNGLSKEVLRVDHHNNNKNKKNNNHGNKVSNNKKVGDKDNNLGVKNQKECNDDKGMINGDMVMSDSLQVSQLSCDSLDNDDGVEGDDDIDEEVNLGNQNSMDVNSNGKNDDGGDDDGGDKNGVNDGGCSDDDDDVNLDMHSLVLSPIGGPRNEVKNGADDDDVPMFTAEQVISEIEEMMEEMSGDEEKDGYDDDDNGVVVEGGQKGELSLRKEKRGGKTACYDNIPLRKLNIGDVSKRSMMELGELFEEMEGLVGEYSDALINQLARRDQLEYELEIKNSFISLFLKLQKKKRALMSRRKTLGKSVDMSSLSVAEKVYLTTTIPYNHHNQPPSSQLLSTYLKILRAMDEEDSNLPLILTQYILKVVCPT